ncbi:MAG: two-component regulator propeller domain-containing protein [Marinagarivorans sp.]
MSRTYKRFFLVFSLIYSIWLCVGASIAQEYPNKISFQDIMRNQDIALGEVEALWQDYEGFMWLGGRNALLRYDGYDFLSIKVDDAKDTSKKAPVNQVVDLFEDSRKDLWVATRSGLLKYDRNAEVLRTLHQGNGTPVQIYNDTVNAVIEAPTGEILAGSFIGLSVVDPRTLNVTTISNIPGDSSSLPNNVVHAIFKGKDGALWLGTDVGLSRLDWTTKKITTYIPDPKNPSSQTDNAVWRIQVDREGQLWLAVQRGVFRFNPQTEQFKRYLNDPADRYSYSGKITRDVFMDSSGVVWIGTDEGGLNVYDYERDRFLSFQHVEGKLGAISSNSIRRIYEDKSGDLWVGTYPSGVNFHDRSTAAITVYSHDGDPKTSLMGDAVEAVVEDHEGNIWIGSGGVTKFNRKDDTLTHYKKTDGADARINSTAIISGFVDSDNDIWFGTWAGGLQHYNPNTDRFEQIPFDATLAGNGQKTSTSLNDGSVWHIYEDKQKTLWIATHFGGLSKYDKKTKVFTNYTQTPEDPTTLSNKLVWTMMEDSKGRFWVGTASGLNLMDRDKGTFKQYKSDPNNPAALVNNSVLSIYEDKKGRVWFGTDGGLHLYNEQNDNFSVYNTKDGFVDNGIRSIIEDEANNLWLGTNNGVVMFNPDTKLVKNFRRYNGEQIGGFATGAAIATRRGEMVFGGKNGLRFFDVKKLSSNQKVPPVVVTDFRLFTKPVAVNGPDELLSQVINQTSVLTFDYKKTMFSFGFSALNFRDPDKNQYAYKLEGFDDKWREVGNQRTALYTNISAGEYTFKVKASNNDGVWNEVGRAIVIRQLPPPWKTWWAYSLYGLICLGIVVQFVLSQRKKRRLVEEQNRILEIRVAERTSELRAKNDDIQAMLSNMRQGLFTLESSGNIHQEYSLFLEEIFETKEIAGRNVMDLLFGKAQLGSDTFDQVKEAIGSIIGEGELSFDFNSHLLVKEYQADFNGSIKYLSLDWNPIVVDDVIAKLMVSVRDVTQLRQMEAEAKNKKRELDIISQLLNVPAKKFLTFAESAKQFIADNRQHIQAAAAYSESVVALLFRNMHTIKGNCRTFAFSYFSDIVHEVESDYSALTLSKGELPWEPDKLLANLVLVEEILAEYERVFYTVLGRGDGSTGARDQNGFWADSKAMQTIQACIDKVTQDFPAVADAEYFAPIQTMLEKAQSNTLEEVLGDIVDSLGSIANQLDKDRPLVNIDAHKVRIKTNSHELLTNVFAHILRNSVDHGIETPEERTQKGKAERGTINIAAEVVDGHLDIHVRDDGQGINVDKLFQKGVENGRWQANERPTYQDIAQLIFVSGISTKDKVSDISGRGVGMDAAMQFLLAQGGAIALNLSGVNTLEAAPVGSGVKIPFELVVTLPAPAFLQAA